jgi:hypothetical protein
MDVISGDLGGHFFTHTPVHRILVPTKASVLALSQHIRFTRNKCTNLHVLPEYHFTKLERSCT